MGCDQGVDVLFVLLIVLEDLHEGGKKHRRGCPVEPTILGYLDYHLADESTHLVGLLAP